MSIPIQGQDFVILSIQDWDVPPTRKHHFSRMWARAGNRVLYVEQEMHWLGWLADIKNQFGRVWRWLQGPREVEANLWVFTLPVVLPFFQMSAWINRLNNAFLLPIVRSQMRRLGFKAPILLTYAPFSADLVGKLGEQAAVYECVDDFTASKGLVNPQVLGRLEQQLIRTVDLLIVTHPALYESKGAGARCAKIVPNGVEAEHFAQAADPTYPLAEAFEDLQHPVIGYLGGINYWIDTALLAEIARQHADWTVVLVGPQELLADISPLKGLPNVVLTGRVPYEEVPRYVKAFDVCVNPYVLDGVAEHCSPLKLYDYLATGKPIVSVDMPEARKFEGLIDIARDRDEFVTLVERAVERQLSDAGDERSKQRMAEARKHTWRSRFEDVSAALMDIL